MRQRAVALGRALAASISLLLGSACAGVVLPQPAAGLVPPTPLEAAEAQRRSGDLEGAARAYASLREATPAEVRAHLGYVRTLLEAGRRSVVREEYAARAAQPQAQEVDRVLAERLAGDGASTTLRDLYARAVAREPASPWWPLALAEVELAEADAWRLRREEARAAGDRGAETAADRQARGALLRADRALDRVATLEGAPFEGEVLRGYVRAVEGDLAATSAARQAAYRAALDCFERVTVLAPARADGWYGAADMQTRLGDSGESLRGWMEAARRAPSDPYPRMELGRTLQQLGRGDDAVASYEQAAVLRVRWAEPWIRIGDTQAEDERWARAAAAYREALVRDPAAVEAWARLGSVLEQDGDLSGAREAYERYLEQHGERQQAVQRALERLPRAGGAR